jgi:hypoxanthine-guanine phosphoribosyltransferase
MAFYTFIYITYLNPEMLADVSNMTEQTILQTNPEVSEEELEMALEISSKLMQPHFLMIMSVLGGTFMGFLFSAVISFFVKKTDINNLA